MTTLGDVIRPRALRLLLALPALAFPLFVGSLVAGIAEHAGWALALEEARNLDIAFDANPTTDRICAAIRAHGDARTQTRASQGSTCIERRYTPSREHP